MIRALVLAAVAVVGGCAYDVSFRDCDIRVCRGPEECPSGFTCDGDGFCRSPGATQSCAAVLGDANLGTDSSSSGGPSCRGTAASCATFSASNACLPQTGCGWVATKCKVVIDCEAVPTASECDVTPGCAIDYTGAGGTWCKPYQPFCSSATSKTQCEAKPECKFEGGCIGVADGCGAFPRQDTCNAQAGCSWH